MSRRIAVKRVYAPALAEDGVRVLVDRLWPRGLSRDKAAVNHWFKELAPSAQLRRWFGHEPKRWDEFRRRYTAELDARPDAVAGLQALCAAESVTLVYAAKDESHNNAVALREYLVERG